MGRVKIAASILSADFNQLGKDIKRVSSADWLHIDVMDGHFVPNLTMGPALLSCIKSKKFKDVHLMVEKPLMFVKPFARAGADGITFHIEAKDNPVKVIKEIRKYKKKVGITLNPNVSLNRILPYVKKVDMVLFMSVYPGYSGQKFIPSVLPKIKKLRQLYPRLDIEIDGGINDKTAKLAKDAGANILVSASYLFKHPTPKKAIEKLRKA